MPLGCCFRLVRRKHLANGSNSPRFPVRVFDQGSILTTPQHSWPSWKNPVVLLDVNVLVYAHREDTQDHEAYLAWLENLVNSDQAYGLSDLVLSGFLRVATHPKVFTRPSTMGEALAFVQELRGQPNCSVIAPGPRHWEIFCRLCQATSIKGN